SPEGLELVQGARVVDERLDTARCKVSAQLVARGRPDDELMVDVVAARGLDGERNPGRADAASIVRGVGATPGVPPFQPAKLQPEDRGLELVQARVQSRLAERERPALAVAPQPPQPSGQRGITRRDGTRI